MSQEKKWEKNTCQMHNCCLFLPWQLQMYTRNSYWKYKNKAEYVCDRSDKLTGAWVKRRKKYFKAKTKREKVYATNFCHETSFFVLANRPFFFLFSSSVLLGASEQNIDNISTWKYILKIALSVSKNSRKRIIREIWK